ncbi:uncharacterized protein K02A2.6-like [Phymastichus coffea]|uniref:uncharacterized protein K02A2.6-like n=1 Tax=Phymastichus coffea TaxID=108790 RepID=UPI00273AC203|nr:uncharacterized protein K02A2.6-like [Phymastichus coffea]
MLRELHISHMGVVRMKMLAHSYIWWTTMDLQIENKCKQYSHSKWIDIRELNNITSETTIDVFRDYFTTWGLPNTLVTDNGPTFTSKLFEDFMISNGVLHQKTAPYHPASNGAAENVVNTFKAKIKILIKEFSSRKEALAKYLFHYRLSPHYTTGVSPAELQLGRKFRTRWDLLKERIRNTVTLKQQEQKKHFRGNRDITFDEVVMSRDYANNNWRKAEVSDHTSRTPEKCGSSISIVHQSNSNVKEMSGVCENDVATAASSVSDQSKILQNTCSPKSHVVIQDNHVQEQKTADEVPTLRRLSRVIRARKILDL